MTSSLRRAALVAVSALLAACVAEGEPTPQPVHPWQASGDDADVTSPEPPPAPGKPAEISPAQAEAEAVMAQVSFGLDAATLPKLSAGRLLTEDFDGNPYMYLVFTAADRAIRAPLSFVVSSAPDAGDTTTAVGAGPDRPAMSLAAPNLELLASIQRTVAELGGESKLRRIVAATPSVFLIESTDGSYWDVETGGRVPADVLIDKRAAITESMQSAEAVDEAARLRDEWNTHLSEAPSGASTASSLADADGDLDLARAFVDARLSEIVSSMRPQEITPSALEDAEAAPLTASAVSDPVEESCRRWWFFGWRTACDLVEYGHISKAERQAHVPIQTRAFTLPKCVVGGKLANVYQGCGPAAMTALVWRSWQDGMSFPSLSDFERRPGGATSAYPYREGGGTGFANSMESVLGIAFASEMGTCTPANAQGLTLPSGFERGANRWLTKQGASVRLAHATSIVGLHRFDAARKASLLHRLVGVQERPVIALGDVGFLVAHYAPVARYRIVNPKSPFPQVWVKMLGWTDMWVNLHGSLQLTSALYWFEKK
jgi:hypothetical protein